jgi:hypothetical protein
MPGPFLFLLPSARLQKAEPGRDDHVEGFHAQEALSAQ